jgi:Sensors of blue-light using FAD
MNVLHQLYEVLYVSTIATSTPLSAVAEIARHARRANEERHVTGLLVFDGHHFCQQIEGNKKTVLALIEKIKADPRHRHVEVLHHGDLAQRRFHAFSMGYSAVDDVDALAAIEQQYGQEAMASFMKLAATVEL